MSTLVVVEEILRETQVPMSVRQIVELAGDRLPTKSKTPDTVVARDLSMDIKRKGEASLFIRTSPGRYSLRELQAQAPAEASATATLQAAAGAADASDGVAASPHATASHTIDAPAGEQAQADGDTTPVLSTAMRADRAATLPAKKPALADEQTGTAHQ